MVAFKSFTTTATCEISVNFTLETLMFTRSPQGLSSLKQAFQRNLKLAINHGEHYEKQF
jgi:hypothetical protein